MSWLSSFTGMDAANDAAKANKNLATQNKQISADAQRLVFGEGRNVEASQNLMAGQFPTIGAGLTDLARLTSAQGRGGLVDSFGQSARGQAQTAGANADSMFSGNPDLAQGYKLGAMNDANEATTRYSAQINSPEGRSRAFMAYLQAMGMIPSGVSNYGSLAGVATGAAAGAAGAANQGAQVAQQNMAGIGSLIGLFAGM